MSKTEEAKSNLKIILFILIAIIALAILALLKVREEMKKMPVAKIKAIAIDLADKEHTKISLDLEVKNPLRFSVGCWKSTYEVRLEGKKILEGELLIGGEISSKGTRIINLPLVLDVNKIREIREANIGKPTTLQLSGLLHFTGKIAKHQTTVSFEISKELPPQEGLKWDLKDLRITSISPHSLTLEVNLSLESKVTQEISQLHADYSGFLENQKILEGKLDLKPLPSLQSSTAKISLVIDAKTWKKIKKENMGQMGTLVIQGNLSAEIGQKKLDLPKVSITKEILFREKSFDVSLEKLRVKKLIGKERTFAVVVKVKNLTDMKIKKLKIEGDIVIAKEIEIKVLNKEITLPPGETAIIETEVTTDRLAILKLIKSLIQEKRAQSKWDLKLKGESEDGISMSEENFQESFCPVEEN